jgi:hypothetical protein
MESAPEGAAETHDVCDARLIFRHFPRPIRGARRVGPLSGGVTPGYNPSSLRDGRQALPEGMVDTSF